MTTRTAKTGAAELTEIRRQSRHLFWAVGVFSAVVNILMLTGPLYMLNVYDRVLGSGSFETLAALTILVLFLYACMGILDHVRGRIMSRIGANFQAQLDRRVFEATTNATIQNTHPALARSGLTDLESIQRLIASPALMAAFDLPFTPIFFVGIFLFHGYLGILAVIGAGVLIAITLANRFQSRGPSLRAHSQRQSADIMGHMIRSESEMVGALGMRNATFARWKTQRDDALFASITASDQSGAYAATSKSMRLFLQSAMLGLGAYLVLQGQLTAGAMIAGSILLGRGLAPIEQIIGQWDLFERASSGWTNLSKLLGAVPAPAPRTQLPRPKAILEAQSLTVVPPGESSASLRVLTFRLEPGHAVGVIGPSGAGKSTLAKAITGIWPAAGGKIRLDGAALDQYDPDVLAGHIGYLPQRVQLLDGTIKENIVRMAINPDDSAVIQAAQKAAAHDMILKLPNGYDTQVSAAGGKLSGGQIQRIGLARALYGDPVLLVLDEPNSNLDNDGSAALNAAIRAHRGKGGSVMIMAHRPAAIQECDLLMMIENGTLRDFGPKDDVLSRVVRNHADIQRNNGLGGIS